MIIIIITQNNIIMIGRIRRRRRWRIVFSCRSLAAGTTVCSPQSVRSSSRPVTTKRASVIVVIIVLVTHRRRSDGRRPRRYITKWGRRISVRLGGCLRREAVTVVGHLRSPFAIWASPRRRAEPPYFGGRCREGRIRVVDEFLSRDRPRRIV